MIYCYLLNSSIVANVNVSANMNSVEMKQTNYIYSQCSNMKSLQIEFIVVFIVLIYHSSVSLRYSHYSVHYVNSITKYN